MRDAYKSVSMEMQTAGKHKVGFPAKIAQNRCIFALCRLIFALLFFVLLVDTRSPVNKMPGRWVERRSRQVLYTACSGTGMVNRWKFL